ncbi:Alpha/Beta hydrolase protein [Cristinia sonorae]|uniref:Carboxylic ester hydrolase n=1 Tax=Cristinia sonorae TaxID=1940300 RepID=A0A8K0UNU1_9AGAR|nr:Alpha/Beta hydrolase protein [Cristinia sonorae]
MALLKFVLSALVLCTPVLASPLSHRDGDLVAFPPFVHRGILCDLPIPIVQKFLCPRQGTPSLTVNTPLGTAHGAADASDVAIRYSVKYANAQRWQESSVVTSWSLPNGKTDPTALPLACAQDGLSSSAMSEDCLSMILYVPKRVAPNAKLPTLVWVHGGSFHFGSATGPGLDGSNLADATNSIVAVIQYRLGVFGFFAPNGPTNLGVKDAMNALRFLKTVVPSFGGDSNQITIAGQSAGASLIRALLATPSAQSLFKSAILQSDTMDYGMLSTGTKNTLQTFFNQQLPCSASDNACLNGLSTSQIIDAQLNLLGSAFGLDPASTQAEPIRPVVDGTLITTTLTDSTPFPAVSKSILVSTVKDEAGFTIYGGFSGGLDPATYTGFITMTFGNTVAGHLLSNVNYAVPPSDVGNESADVRPLLSQMGTDQVWRCANWQFARSWTQNGGKVYLGEYVVGASYPGNDGVSFCSEPGSVCHQDDIEIVFGTVPNPNAAQAQLTKEMQARYKQFLRTGIPNAPGFANWAPSTTTNVHALTLGGPGEVPAGACEIGFWGGVVPFDYQLFNL